MYKTVNKKIKSTSKRETIQKHIKVSTKLPIKSIKVQPKVLAKKISNVPTKVLLQNIKVLSKNILKVHKQKRKVFKKCRGYNENQKAKPDAKEQSYNKEHLVENINTIIDKWKIKDLLQEELDMLIKIHTKYFKEGLKYNIDKLIIEKAMKEKEIILQLHHILQNTDIQSLPKNMQILLKNNDNTVD